MLPLDLHVLSLSLAFILSQDQTLRCLYIVFFFSQKNQTKLLLFLFCLHNIIEYPLRSWCLRLDFCELTENHF